MKSKKHALMDKYSFIKESYEDLISISDLAQSCDVSPRTIQRYLVEDRIYCFNFNPKKRGVIVDSLLPDFKKPSTENFHKFIKNKSLYCTQEDLIFGLGYQELQIIKNLKLKTIVFKGKSFICMASLNDALMKMEKLKEVIINEQ